MDRNSGVDRKVSINGLSANAKGPRPKNANTSQNTGESLKRIAKGAGISIVGLVFAKVLNYIYRFIISRAGAEAYGTFSLAVAVTGFLTIIALVGLQSGALRYVSIYSAKNDVSKLSSIIRSSLRIAGCTSIILAVILFTGAGYIAELFHTPGLTLALRILAVAMPFDALTQIFYAVLLGFKRIRYYTYSLQIISPALKVLSATILTILGYKLYAMIGSTVLSVIVTFFITLYFLEKRVHPFLKIRSISFSFEKELLNYSAPLGFSGFIYLLMSWTDTLFLGYFKDSVAVGIYNVAVPTAQLLYIIPSAFGTLFPPLLTEAYGLKDKVRMQEIYKAVIRWNIYFNVPMFLILALFSQSILRIFFGAEYVSGYTSTVILSFSVLTSSVANPAVWILVAYNKARTYFNITVFSAIVNIFLNILLIPPFGLEGAAFATLSSSLLLGVLSIYSTKKCSGLTPVSGNIIKSILSALIAISVIGLLTQYIHSRSAVALLAFSIVYFAIYVVIMFAVRAVEKDDVALLKGIKRRIGL